MSLRDLGEDGFIAALRRGGLAQPAGVIRGIGDDAAVFEIGAGRVVVVSTDLLLEGIHFRLARTEGSRLGARAMAVNLSDLAAMGATPRQAFLGIGAPGSLPSDLLLAIASGFQAEGARHGVNLLGGDTCGSESGLVLAVTVIGDGLRQQLCYRSGAKAGDVLCVTGGLGESAAGLLLLERGVPISSEAQRRLVAAHESPVAQVEQGQWLACSGAVTAMIDVSDGLLTDLGRILAESGSGGATLEMAQLPVSGPLQQCAAELGVEASRLALDGGEDYCLLVAVRESELARLGHGFAERFGRPLIAIGRVEGTPGVRVRIDGRLEDVVGRGYRHWGPQGGSGR